MRRYSYLLLASIFAVANAVAQPYERPDEVDPSISFKTLSANNWQLHYAAAGNVDKPGLMFVHGTPGDWTAFEMYLSNTQLQQDFFMVSVDRLGWGKSQSPDLTRDQATEQAKFKPQVEPLISIMRQYPNKQWMIIGHSLGASLAPMVALLAPEQTHSLLLLAGSLDPKLGKPRWYNRLGNTLVAKWFMPKMLEYSNDEIMILRAELQAMDKAVKATQLPANTTIMQGMKDKLVSPKNPAYAAEHWRSNFAELNVIELPEAGHFLPWEHTPQVIEAIYQLMPIN